MGPIVLAISGASGIVLGFLTLKRLVEMGQQVHLVMTKDASITALYEMGEDYSSSPKWLKKLSTKERELVTTFKINDFTAPMASGSFRTKGMCIVPCSMATLAAISCGLADNLIRRAADVTLKERRPLIIVPREAPFNTIHLENMLKLSQMGAVISPPTPAWYMNPKSLEEVENFMVNRILDGLKLENHSYNRWSG